MHVFFCLQVAQVDAVVKYSTSAVDVCCCFAQVSRKREREKGSLHIRYNTSIARGSPLLRSINLQEDGGVGAKSLF